MFFYVLDEVFEHGVGFLADDRLAKLPNLAQNTHVRLHQEFRLIGTQLLEHHGGFTVDSTRGHAIFRLGTQGRAPVLVVLFFDNYLALKIEGYRSDSDFQCSLIGCIVDFADRLNSRQRLCYLGNVHEKVPKRFAGNWNLRALGKFQRFLLFLTVFLVVFGAGLALPNPRTRARAFWGAPRKNPPPFFFLGPAEPRKSLIGSTTSLAFSAAS